MTSPFATFLLWAMSCSALPILVPIASLKWGWSPRPIYTSIPSNRVLKRERFDIFRSNEDFLIGFQIQLIKLVTGEIRGDNLSII